MKSRDIERPSGMVALVPWIVGVACFLLVLGPRVLDPGNLAWLGDGDASQHFLGWQFFRAAEWSLPLGMSPRYGLELASSVVYTDSNPLLAFLLKPFSGLLPADFQYFGFWLLLCFMLQAWMAWRLLSLVSPDLWLRAAGTIFFVLAPPLLIRMSWHMSLGAHFLLLAALYLVLAPALRRRRLAWGAVLATGVLVHAYLFVMVAALWLVDLLGRWRARELRARQAMVEFALLFACSAALSWLAGYFTGGGDASSDFGLYRSNLLSLVDPRGWSYLLRSLPSGPGDYEGAAYLGLGGLLLLAFALPGIVSAPRVALAGARRLWLFFLALAGFFAFALSHRIGLGGHEWTLPVPEVLIRVANTFRSSGRMMWVVYYAILAGAILVIARSYRRRTAAILVVLAAVVQVVDTSAGWRSLRTFWMQPRSAEWATSLSHPFWAAAGARYAKLRHVPLENAGRHWRELGWYAGRHGMATDAVYLARIDQARLDELRAAMVQRIESSEYEPDVLYIVDERTWSAARRLARRDSDLMARIDGYHVIAPGWKQCEPCVAAMADESMPAPLGAAPREASLALSAAGGRAEHLLGVGWSYSEDWAVWSDTRRASLLLPLDRSVAHELRLELHPQGSQRVQVLVDGRPAAEFMAEERGIYAVPVPGDDNPHPSGLTRVQFVLPDAARPVDVDGSPDFRLLGVALIGLETRVVD